MNTLSEIKAAIAHLPAIQQAALLAFLTQRVKQQETARPVASLTPFAKALAPTDQMVRPNDPINGVAT